MKINYQDHFAKPSSFSVRADIGIPIETREQILKEFNDVCPEMDEYLKLDEQIYQMIKNKKKLLAKIKHNFETFSKIEYPEYDL